MVDVENMTVTCSVCGRTKRIDELKYPNPNFIITEDGEKYTTVKRDDVCERCLEINAND